MFAVAMWSLNSGTESIVRVELPEPKKWALTGNQECVKVI